MKINIYKAKPTFKNIENVIIEIKEQIPDPDYNTGNYDQADDFFTEQAKILGDALVNSLPGGTVDRLLVYLLDHKRCRYVVKG
jgi:hypothetical protein